MNKEHVFSEDASWLSAHASRTRQEDRNNRVVAKNNGLTLRPSGCGLESFFEVFEYILGCLVVMRSLRTAVMSVQTILQVINCSVVVLPRGLKEFSANQCVYSSRYKKRQCNFKTTTLIWTTDRLLTAWHVFLTASCNRTQTQQTR